MAAFYWIKLYDEILDDPKMGRLSDGAYRLCINLFLLASRQDERDGRLPDFDDIGWLLRLSSDKLQELWQELERAEIVCMVDGLPFVTNFKTRQDKVSDAERMRRYRERKRLEEMGKSDEDDTPELQVGNEGVTNRNADIDKDIELDKEKKEEDIYMAQDLNAEFQTALSLVAKERLAVGFNEKKYENAAFALMGWEAELSQVAGFAEYWKAKGWHPNKPSLTNVINHWQDYLAGRDLKAKPNGRNGSSHLKPAPPEERTPGAY